MKQFDIKRDVRQCDPLSSFLFILAMEGLNIAMKEACIFLRNEDACLSHLMYADDVTFIGEWSEMNFVNLNRILRCFYLSSVYGVGVENIEINRLASILCCEPANFPFSYHGLPIEANMNLSKNWKPIIDKFNSKLSKWKSNNSLSRDTLVKPKKYGGLGIGCLRSLNLALLSKWKWRLKTETNSLWSKCVKYWHKISCIDGKRIAKASLPGLIERNVGSSDKTHFWKDFWCDNIALKDAFPNLDRIEAQKNCLIKERIP
uniref:Reverse transcriptase domain-containing protein n=1 Tax=Lactuca sativa TaxID=4236 RepID=A0A9R1X653_LACSA|nr:hypothetical protein LSAT_V11C700354610 [Lactuca sativa]